MFRTIVLAAVVAFAPMVGPLSPARALAAPAGSPQADLAAISRYGLAQQQVLTDISGLVGLSVQGIEKAVGFGLAGAASRQDAKAWGGAWEADMRARMAALKAWKSRVPPLPRAEIQRQLPAGLSTYERMPARIDAMVTGIVEFGDSIIVPTRKAAEGDRGALAILGSEYFRGSALLIRAENEMLELSASGIPDNNPAKALALSNLASNKALGVYLDYMAMITRAEQPDYGRMAAEIRTESARAAEQARAVATSARALRAELSRSSIAGKDKLLAVLATYDESAAVETEVAALTLSLAEPVEKGVLVTAEVQARMAPVQQLVQRRLEINTRRLALLQGL